jgi:ribosomal protein S6
METTTEVRPYEISFLIRSEEDLQGVVALLKEHGATVTDEGQTRKLALAYPIKRVTDGYFGWLKATMTAENAKLLENASRTSNAALRLLILTDEPIKPAKVSTKKPVRKERVEKPVTASNDDLQKEIERLTSETE